MSSKNVCILALLIFFTCCKKSRNNKYFELKELKKIAQLTSITPPPIVASSPVYVKDSENSILETSFLSLKHVYDESYYRLFPDFHSFLFNMLNQKIRVDTPISNPGYFSDAFLLNREIVGLYDKNGISGLIDKYIETENGINYLKKGKLSLNEINSLSYFFFINRFIRVDDDYSATISFKKLDTLIQ